ncbi:ATP-binding protein [Pseudomonas sp. 5P_3.1_Bac2]|uniref:ATP-binding protein n=1 Tax=Pseudomonas sp. 5P_3.1_Bac2 TaxID=2971617 RepID=UPI0021C6765F|nr:ATP-binding protein [Pseudomonas sp. 5P_3.1_Bac2]MCU1718598.1 ATP-binding protein [Pseudomonas sp. 5P_3.1_Bac2]
MKLRSRLFLGSSALLTVALAGLLLGIIGVVQLTKAQNQSIARNLQILDAAMVMSQSLSQQVMLLLAEDLNRPALQRASGQFDQALHSLQQLARTGAEHQAIGDVEATYQAFSGLLSKPYTLRRELLNNDAFGFSLEALTSRINAIQMRCINAVEREEARGRERAWMVASLLCLSGLAVLVIGFSTAHSLARRFAQPIETLAKAADQIGQGDFDVILPRSTVTELTALSQRFGLMASALRDVKNSDVQALQTQQQRLQAVLDSINDGLLIVDRDGCIEHFNPLAQRQLGWSEAQLGQSISQALPHPKVVAQLQQVLQAQPLDRSPDDLTVQIDGEKRLLAYSLSGVSDKQAQVLCAVMVLRDVTEQRAFERVRSEFVLRASHELRTPVTGMRMAFALLQERLHVAAQSREADLLNTVDEEMQRLLRLIDDLLNLSRYHNGLQSLERLPCALAPLLQQAQQRFANQAAELGLKLSCNLQEPLPELLLDHLQIERVLDNLLANALRHSNRGGEVRLHARTLGDRVLISVLDSGEGIPYQQQERIFEPFIQASRKKGGAGLGLALCKEIVQLHGGQIGVHSQVGQGAQFYISLPL